ncbi:MAG: CoA transferase [Thermodesulfobacteriota bacterium]
MARNGPLEGIKILDFTHVLSGPFGSALLGDLGAEIIKVEPPDFGDNTRYAGPPFQNGESPYFFCCNRNKRSIVVDLKRPEGVEVIRRLLPGVDVFMENFRPGVMDRLGLGYEQVKAIKPDLIYASLTAFGREGPYKHKPGYEVIVQGLTGLIHLTSPPGGPPAKIQVQLVDLCTGMFLAYAVLGALYDRLATGRGRRVETSLLESTLAMLAHLAGMCFMQGHVPNGLGTRNPLAMPSQAFRTKDSHVVVVAPGKSWDRFCAALGQPDWAKDPDLSNGAYRVQHYGEVSDMVEKITAARTTREWLDIFEAHDLAAGPINTIAQAFEDPGVRAVEMVKTMAHPKAGEIQILREPWRLSGVEPGPWLPPPLFGQHTVQVLQEYGFTESEIEELKRKGAVTGL